VQRDRQPDADGLLGQLEDVRHEAARGNGDAARAEAQSPVGVDDGERLDERVVVGQRFAHAHDDDVIERRHLGLGARRERILAVAHVQELGDDLAGGEVAFESGQSARAEHAAHRAADLRGDADGLAGVIDAHALLRCADDHRFDEGAVAQFEEELVGDVLRLFVEQERGGHEVEGLVEPEAQRLRQVAHFVPGAGALFVHPLEDLLRAKGRLAARGQPLGERGEGFAGERRLGWDKLHAPAIAGRFRGASARASQSR